MSGPLRYGDDFTDTVGKVLGTALDNGLGTGLGNVLSSAFIQQFKTIEIRTSLSPPVVMNVAELLDTTSPPSAFSQFLQPTVILTPAAGQPTVIAPYGVATNGSSAPGFLLLAALLGVGFALGRLSKR